MAAACICFYIPQSIVLIIAKLGFLVNIHQFPAASCNKAGHVLRMRHQYPSSSHILTQCKQFFPVFR